MYWKLTLLVQCNVMKESDFDYSHIHKIKNVSKRNTWIVKLSIELDFCLNKPCMLFTILIFCILGIIYTICNLRRFWLSCFGSFCVYHICLKPCTNHCKSYCQSWYNWNIIESRVKHHKPIPNAGYPV